MKLNVLIPGCGTGNGYAAAECINKHFNDRIDLFLTDINPRELVSAANFSKNYYQSPLISNKEYKNFLIDLIESKKINICVPFIDDDVKVLSILQSENKISRDIYIQVKSDTVTNICSDKYLAYKWMSFEGINTPTTFEINEEFDFNDIIYKPRTGFGSKIIQDGKNAFDKINTENKTKYIAQIKCEAPEVTVDFFRDKNSNESYYLCRERIATKEGVCTKARLFIDEELKEIGLIIASKLNLNYFCFQVMRLNNQWAVIDINPRLGAGTSMSETVGMDFFAAMIANVIQTDHSPYIKQFTGERYVTRQYKNILSIL
jgi:carbamoylphosphate synthase large subunit